MQKVREERAKILKEKEIALQQLREKALKKKEKLTTEIMMYGLWQSEQETQGLDKLKTKAEKLKALKTQLEFRRKVLEQTTLTRKYSSFPKMESDSLFKRSVGTCVSCFLHQSQVQLLMSHLLENESGTVGAMQTAPSSGTWGEYSVLLVEQMIGLMCNMTTKVKFYR